MQCIGLSKKFESFELMHFMPYLQHVMHCNLSIWPAHIRAVITDKDEVVIEVLVE
jgi:hypothetical protein